MGQREERESHRFMRLRKGLENIFVFWGDSSPYSFIFWRITLMLMRMQFTGRRQSQMRQSGAKTWKVQRAHCIIPKYMADMESTVRRGGVFFRGIVDNAR